MVKLLQSVYDSVFNAPWDGTFLFAIKSSLNSFLKVENPLIGSLCYFYQSGNFLNFSEQSECYRLKANEIEYETSSKSQIRFCWGSSVQITDSARNCQVSFAWFKIFVGMADGARFPFLPSHCLHRNSITQLTRLCALQLLQYEQFAGVLGQSFGHNMSQ